MSQSVLHFRPVGSVRGEVQVPSSKSILNRALLCAASADRPTELRLIHPAEDAEVMRAALSAVGVKIRDTNDGWLVEPHAPQRSAATIDIDLGEAGTVARFLPPWLAAGRGNYRLDGRGRLRERPQRPMAHALIELGAHIKTAENGALPWILQAQGLVGASLRVPASLSSQFLSGLLLVGPLLERGALEILIVGELRSRPYVEMTRSVMRSFGVETEARDQVLRVAEGARYRSPGTYQVEADASGAAFFFVAAALTGGSVRVRGLRADSMQGDLYALELLSSLGMQTSFDEMGASAAGYARGGFDANFADCPDLAPAFAVLAAVHPETSRLRGVATLRAKESDRLLALEQELTKAGAQCRVEADTLEVRGPIHGDVHFECHGDHRLAMAFSLLGLVKEGVEISDSACVKKSFPGFFQALQQVAPGCVV